MTFGRSVLAVTTGILLLVASASHAVAATVLYYNDFDGGPTWQAALSGLGITPITASGDVDFATKLPTADLAIVQFDGDVHSPALNASLLSYITAGGRVIFSSVADPQYNARFSVNQVGSNAIGDFMTTIHVGAALSGGLSSSDLTVMNNTNLVTFWRSFAILPTDLTAMGLAMFEDNNFGIVLGNNGRTIINGFGGSTLYPDILSSDSSDEIRLYQNEVGLLIAPVPEPATGALLGLGLVITAALGYRRRK